MALPPRDAPLPRPLTVEELQRIEYLRDDKLLYKYTYVQRHAKEYLKRTQYAYRAVVIYKGDRYASPHFPSPEEAALYYADHPAEFHRYCHCTMFRYLLSCLRTLCGKR